MKTAGWRTVEGRERFCNAAVRRGNWRIRSYRAGDETEILALCERIFGSQLSLKRWRWRDLENPAGQAIVFVAEKKEGCGLVGHISAIPTDLKVGNFSRKGFFLVDSGVDPLFRGKGISAALTIMVSKRSCAEDGGLGFGLPNEQAYLPTLKTGPLKLFTMSLFLKVLNWPKVLNARLRPAFLANAIGALFQRFGQRRQCRNREGLAIEDVTRFGEQVDDLWQRVAHRFAISAIRKATALNWRYFDCPDSPYRALAVSRNGQWQGYIVITILKKWGLRLGTLVDLFFDPDCAPAGELLIDQAEARLRADGAEALWCVFACPEIYRKILRKAGFFKVPPLKGVRQFHFVADFVSLGHFRPDLEARDGALLRQGDKWFFSLGDTDLA